jgi:hypothetical protein
VPPRKPKPELATALRHFAWKMADDPEAYTQDEGRMMDRALRSCDGISDIDRVWVRWRYIGEKYGWITAKEMVVKRGRYVYPEQAEEDDA